MDLGVLAERVGVLAARPRTSASSMIIAGVPNSRGQVADVDAADGQHAVDPVRAARPDRRVDLVQVLGRGRGMVGGQHVRVQRPGRVGDTAQQTVSFRGTPPAPRLSSGVMSLTGGRAL